MVNPRWRPTIANSISTSKTKLKDDRIDGFDLPKPEPYIGRYIDADIDGVKVSNGSRLPFLASQLKYQLFVQPILHSDPVCLPEFLDSSTSSFSLN